MKTILTAKNIFKSFGSLKVLSNINLSINVGEIVSIVGPSGAGKTTLLEILSTLSKPDNSKRNTLIIDSKDVTRLNNNELAKLRNQDLGFIFQSHKLLPEFNAIENVMLPSLLSGLSKEDSKRKSLDLLFDLGIGKKYDHYPNELSGGEQQRVAIARALINNPKIIFADEPSGNLDTKNADMLHQLFFKLRSKTNQTFIIVTHNQKLADMTDRKIELLDGNILKNEF